WHFFFQAEDGIRGLIVTGVQTCALPISCGNMDFNEIVEGATVYLPASVPGALLYVGDGHAIQGDGELNGNALETSMDVEFTVDEIGRASCRESGEYTGVAVA